MANILVKSGYVFPSLLPVFLDNSRDMGNCQLPRRGITAQQVAKFIHARLAPSDLFYRKRTQTPEQYFQC